MDFKPHLKQKHPGQQSSWYEPSSDLSGAALEEVDPDDIPFGIKQEPDD